MSLPSPVRVRKKNSSARTYQYRSSIDQSRRRRRRRYPPVAADIYVINCRRRGRRYQSTCFYMLSSVCYRLADSFEVRTVFSSPCSASLFTRRRSNINNCVQTTATKRVPSYGDIRWPSSDCTFAQESVDPMTAPEFRTTTTTMTTRRGFRKQQTRDDGAKPSTGFQAIFPVFLLSAVTFSVLRYVVQPLFGSNEYYIDEEFHVPQARRYCQAAFHQVGVLSCVSSSLINPLPCVVNQCVVWDNKIIKL